jgi:diaminopimelate decarboxylase
MSWKTTIKGWIRPAAQKLLPAHASLPTSHWGLVRREDGVLQLDGLSLPDLCQQWGSPLHVFRPQRLRDNLAGLESQGGKVYFSVKTLPLLGALQVVQQAGCGAETVSMLEWQLAKTAGFQPNQIIANNTARNIDYLDAAIGEGCLSLNLNSLNDLPQLEARAQALGVRVPVLLRIHTASSWSEQFGEAVGATALEAVRLIQASSVLDWRGLHLHRGALMRSQADADHHIQEVLDFCSELQQASLPAPHVLDLGGSLATRTVAGHSMRALKLNSALGVPLPSAPPALSTHEYAQRIALGVRSHFGDHNPPAVWFEPGRSVCGDAQLTLTRVVATRPVPQRLGVLVDAGTNVLDPVRGHAHTLLNASRTGLDSACKIIGPLCHPGDVLVEQSSLPTPQVGDVLAVMDTGAYCFTSSNQFSYLRPAIIAVEHGKARLLRRAETLHDYTACDQT